MPHLQDVCEDACDTQSKVIPESQEIVPTEKINNCWVGGKDQTKLKNPCTAVLSQCM